MKKAVAWAGVFVLVFGVSGCGGSSEAENLVKEQIQLVNDLADAMEAKDMNKILELQKKQEELQKKIEAMKLSPAEDKRLEEKYKGDLEKAMQRLMAAKTKMMSE
jgi:hypothetical protein